MTLLLGRLDQGALNPNSAPEVGIQNLERDASDVTQRNLTGITLECLNDRAKETWNRNFVLQLPVPGCR